LYEDNIKQHFISAANKLLADKGEIIANFGLVKQAIFDTSEMEAEQAALQGEIAITAELIKEAVEENARVVLDQSEYNRKHAALVERYKTASSRLDKVTAAANDKKSRAMAAEAFSETLAKQNLIEAFDEKLWCSLVDFITVSKDGKIDFTFKDGTTVQA